MSLFKEIWASFRWNGGYKDMLKRNSGDTKIGGTIYGKFKDYGAFIKNHRRIHCFFKHWVVIPILFISRRVLGKYLIKEIPEDQQYKNVKIFSDAYDKALYEWNETFRVQMGGLGTDKATVEKHLATYSQNKATKFLNQFKEIMVTGVLFDTAYWGFFDMLMFNIAKEMNQQYHTENPKHLFYTSKSINDVSYFMARRILDQVQLVNVLTPDQINALKAKNAKKPKKAKKMKKSVKNR